MAGLIVATEIRSTDDLHRWCERVRAEAAAASDLYGNMAEALMKRWRTLAVPQEGRFSQFSAHPARRVTRHLRNMAGSAEDVAHGSQALWRDYYKLIYEPMHAPRASAWKI